MEREGSEAPLQPEEDQGRKGTPSSKQARRGEAEEQEGGESKQRREAASKGEEKGNPQAPSTEEDPPGPAPGTQAEQQSPREPPNQSSPPQGGTQHIPLPLSVSLPWQYLDSKQTMKLFSYSVAIPRPLVRVGLRPPWRTGKDACLLHTSA